MMEIRSLSEYLLELHSHVYDSCVEGYSEFALRGASNLFGADQAIWSACVRDDRSHVGRHYMLQNLPQEFTGSLEHLQKNCKARATASSTRNRFLHFSYEQIESNARLHRFFGDFGINHSIFFSTGSPDEGDMFLCFNREGGQRNFGANDALKIRLVTQHLFLTWKQVLQKTMAHSGPLADRVYHRVFLDQLGNPLQLEEGLKELFSRKWPDWTGKGLPEEIRKTLKQARASSGTWFGCSAGKLRVLPAGMFSMLELHETCAVDCLSPREMEVAKLYAKGMTFRDIAEYLGLKPATVRYYLRECYTKLGVADKGALSSLITRYKAIAAAKSQMDERGYH